jgi:hypothetical protein
MDLLDFVIGVHERLGVVLLQAAYPQMSTLDSFGSYLQAVAARSRGDDEHRPNPLSAEAVRSEISSYFSSSSYFSRRTAQTLYSGIFAFGS